MGIIIWRVFSLLTIKMVVLLVMDIPTLATWDGYSKVGRPFGKRHRITEQEYQKIKAELKRKTIAQVAVEFNRAYSSIYNIYKETK